MLTRGQVEWIRRLAEQGLSQRAIQRATGFARDTIHTVLERNPVAPELRDTIYDIEDPVFTDPPARCGGCGATVYMPCLACSLRRS